MINKNSFIFYILFFFSPLFSLGQSEKKLDSLYQKFLKQKTDTVKVNLLFKYGNALIEARKYNEARLQAEELNALSEKVKYPLSVAYYEHLLGRIESFSNKYDLAIYHFDKASLSYKVNNYIQGYYRCVLAKGIMLFYQRKNDEAIESFNEIIKNQSKIIDLNMVGQAYANLGAVYSQIGDNLKSLEYLQKSVPIFIKTNNLKLLANSYNNISGIYFANKDSDKAIEFAFKALKANEQTGNELNLANNYSTIGWQLMEFNKYNESEKWLLKAIEFGKKVSDDRVLAVAYGNLGSLYGKMKDYKKAYQYFELSEFHHKKVNNISGIAKASVSLATAKKDMDGDYSGAISKYKEALKIYEEIKDLKGICNTKKLIGVCYFSLKDYQNAEIFLNEFFEIAKKMNYRDLLKNYYFITYNMYEEQKLYEKSLIHYKLFNVYNDSINNTENGLKLESLKKKYDMEKREEMLRIEFKAREEINEIELQKRRNEIELLEKMNLIKNYDIKKSKSLFRQKELESQNQRNEVEILQTNVQLKDLQEK